ncbi:hypothetical protein LX16_4216 [Stackebrandtia albiflava]|uniref:Uncharacterized protein n=1 Tax=Stackebrandtia albiflava TaxID=406432 RepID=A0A562UYV6_9ACTN|nr:hypothetical protein [Stackebrandtia albiflava]TWJ10792.1 hypothetical protein LX16_4216 [Stackebrandtia albiflava]
MTSHSPQPTDPADTVVKANIGISAAATGGAAASAAILAGQSAPAASAATTAAQHAAHLHTQAAAQAQAAAAGGTASGLGVKIGAGIGVVVLAGAAVTGGVLLSDSGGGATAPIVEPVMDESATGVDLMNTTVLIPSTYRPGTETREVTITDGGFTQEGATPFETVVYEYIHEPVYADLDGDMDLDAVAVMDELAYEYGYPYLLVWLWEDGELVQMDRTIAGLCSIDAVTAEDGAVHLDVSGVAAGARCYGVGNDETLTETLTVSVVDGELVQTAPVFGAVDRCHPLFYQSVTPVEGDLTPRVSPDETATPVAEPGTYDEIRRLGPVDGITQSEWYIVQVDVDGTTSCGWVSHADILG